jgi:hypothetical protein
MRPGSRYSTVVILVLGFLFAGAAQARASLVGRWSFDEGAGGVAHDSSGSGLDGRLDADRRPSWIPGVEGTALHFDDDAVQLPASPLLEPPTITVAAWVRRDGSPGAYGYVISKGGATCYRGSYGLYTGKEGGAAFYVAGDGAYTISPAVAPAQIWDGRWHRLAGTYDGTTVRLYVDGVQVRNGITGPTHIEYDLNSRSPYVGDYRGTCALPFFGDIDAPSIWSGALSTAQLAADAQPPAPPAGDPPLPPGSPPAGGPVGPAPGTPPVSTGSLPGVSTTPRRCISLQVPRRSVRVGHRARVRVVVHRGAGRLARARVLLTSRRLHKALRTDRRGRGHFSVRATRRQHRLTLRVAGRRLSGCGTPKAFVRVRPAPAEPGHTRRP